MKRETLGYIGGGLATITLSEIHVLFGIFCAVIMALCAVPDGVRKWRKLIYDYRTYKEETGIVGVLAFVSYFCGLRYGKKERAQLKIQFPRNGNED